MAKHGIRANRRKEGPKAVIQAAPTFHETTHPAGSAERFLDDAAKEALAASAMGGLPKPKQLVPGALRAVAREAERKYPDPLLSEAAELSSAELARRAARAEAYQTAMKAQNAVVDIVSRAMSPTGNMTANQAAATMYDTATRQGAKGGRTVRAAGGAGETEGTPETAVPEAPAPEASTPQGGPRIVINPTTFRNSKDALCVAFNEGFRLWMEATGFEPQSEPTEKQRRFFSDTAYADDEVQLRRTILARIATFDTSVKDPTDDQLSETASFLEAILESPDWCKNDWERSSVAKLARAVSAAVGAEPVEPKEEPLEARESEPLQRRAAMGGGETYEDEEKRTAAPPQGDDGAEEAKAKDPRYFNESGDTWDDESAPEKGATRFAYQDGNWTKQTYTGEGWNGEVMGSEEGEAMRKKVAESTLSFFSNYISGRGEAPDPEPGQASAEGPAQAPQQNTDKPSKPQKPEDQSAPDMSWEEIIAAKEKLAAARKQRDSADAPSDAPGSEDLETTSGSGAVVHYNEDGSFAGQDNPDGSYSLASGSGEVIHYNADGTLAKSAEEPHTPTDQGGAEKTEPAEPTEPAKPAGPKVMVVGGNGSTVASRRAASKYQPQPGQLGYGSITSMNGPSIQPARPIGDVGARSFTDTKRMNGPSIQPARPIGDVGTTSLTDNGMNGPSIQPARTIGTVDTEDGSGGLASRRKKRRSSTAR